MLPMLPFFFGLALTDFASHRTVQETRVPGIIDFGYQQTQDVLNAPRSVRAGENFKITIMTFGGTCDREGETSAVITATGASVIVYDFTAATHPGVISTAITKRLPHTVSLRFQKPGEALIRIWGRRVGPRTPPVGVPVVFRARRDCEVAAQPVCHAV